MPAEDQRWTEVTPSQFPHEAEGLAIARGILPNTPPFHGWSNFEFRDGHGKWHEIDLLVLGRRRLHLVELKYYSGVLRGDDHRWLRDGHRAEDSPLLLARRKAQRLRSRLQLELTTWARENGQQIPDPRSVVPYVQEAVFLHHPRLQCVLPQASRIDLFGPDGADATTGLPGISARLLEAATPDNAVASRTGSILAALLARIGVVQRRQREAGSWVIDDEPLAEGEGWQDWPAFHRVVTTDRARIRFLVTSPGAAAEERDRTRRLAEHEYRVMSRLAHDGLLRPRDLLDTELGVGLVYPRDKRLQRLDLWLAERPEGIPFGSALSVLRQVAEVVRYAHGNRVVHRGLTPAAVHLRQADPHGLRAVVGDWQTAGTTAGTMAGTTGAGTTRGPGGGGVTALAAARLADVLSPAVDAELRQAEAFQAPEGVWHPDADRVRLDVFALGALAYYLFTRRPPATDRVALRERLTRDDGLDLAADLPQVPPALRALVLAATRPAVSDRLADVGGFLKGLDEVDRALAAPDDVAPVDPLDAAPGTVLDGRFRLERRLGAGSTAVGLLVTDLSVDGAESAPRRVLKVALDDQAADRLAAEAEVLRGLDHPRIVRLLDEPLEVGGRSALLLESAGEATLGEVLRGRARLSLDLLERWGTELLEALVALDRAGVDHRDIKPANLGIREGRGDRVKHLVLFDFSLARAGATAVTAGTPPYLDPFLDTPGRGRFDSAAERYAAAVVLFEMATGTTPSYGDGLSNPAAVRDEATVVPEQLDPSVAGELVRFFGTALARDAGARHDTAADMLATWQSVFAPLPKTGPDDADERADGATERTPLADAGLSARAMSALEPFGVVTVGDLVAVDPVRLNRLSGVAEATRREVKDRARRWRARLATVVTGRGGRGPAAGEGVLPDPAASAELLADRAGTARASARRRAAGLLLGLEPGLEPFGSQGELGELLGVSRVRGQQHVARLQDAWAADPDCCRLLDAVASTVQEALAGLGNVAGVDELGDAVLAALPPAPAGVDARRLAAGLVRAALDRTDALERADAEHVPLARRRRGGRIALLAGDPVLLDVAEAAARYADELVARAGVEAVVPAPRAAAALRAAVPALATGNGLLTDDRVVRLAARLARTAAISGRGELHHRDLSPATAIRHALAGLGAAEPVTGQEIRDRVRARFPSLPPLPDRPRLDGLLAEAGLPLVYDETQRAFRAPTVVADTAGLVSRHATQVTTPAGAAFAAGGHVGQRLAESVRSRSFLALGVDAMRLDTAVRLLHERHGARVVDVTGTLLAAMRDEAAAVGLPWESVRAADAAQPGTREAVGLAALVGRALPRVDAAIEEASAAAVAGGTVVLVTDVAPLARYGHLGSLARWADLTTPRRQAVWVLVPQLPGSTGPVIDDRPLPLAAPGQFLRLDAEWLKATAPVNEGVPT